MRRLRWFEQWALWGVLVFVLAVIVAVVLIERAYAAQSAAAYADRDRVGLRKRPTEAGITPPRPTFRQPDPGPARPALRGPTHRRGARALPGMVRPPGREEMRDRVGHPVTLWKKFASEVIKAAEHDNYDEPAEDHERAEHNNDEDDHNNNGNEEVEARTDAERMAMRGWPSSVERVVLTLL